MYLKKLLKLNKLLEDIFFKVFLTLLLVSTIIAAKLAFIVFSAQLIIDTFDFILNPLDFLESRRELRTVTSAKKLFTKLKSHLTREFFKRVLVGVGLGVSTFFLKLAIFAAELYLYPPQGSASNDVKAHRDNETADNKDTSTNGLLDVFVTVVVAPIVEELYFRGFLIPLIKGAVNIVRNSIYLVGQAISSICSLFIPRSTYRNEPEPVTPEVQKESKFDKLFAGYTSAVIFSNAHEPAARQSAFIGGLMKSGLYEAYDGDLVPCIAQHMTNNALAEALSRVALRCI